MYMPNHLAEGKDLKVISHFTAVLVNCRIWGAAEATAETVDEKTCVVLRITTGLTPAVKDDRPLTLWALHPFLE